MILAVAASIPLIKFLSSMTQSFLRKTRTFVFNLSKQICSILCSDPSYQNIDTFLFWCIGKPVHNDIIPCPDHLAYITADPSAHLFYSYIAFLSLGFCKNLCLFCECFRQAGTLRQLWFQFSFFELDRKSVV